MRYLLDTSAILAHFRQEGSWESVQTLFETEDAELLWASVSLAEFGRRLHDLGASAGEIETTLSNYRLLFTEIVAVDAAIAHAAFVIGCNTPHRLPLVDALIAACAQARSAVLVHRDEHMGQIPASLLRQQQLAPASSP